MQADSYKLYAIEAKTPLLRFVIDLLNNKLHKKLYILTCQDAVHLLQASGLSVDPYNLLSICRRLSTCCTLYNKSQKVELGLQRNE